MMYSNKPDRDRRQYRDRSSRQRSDYDDRREERWEPQRDEEQDSYHDYDRDGQKTNGRTRRSREFRDSPKRPYRDSLNRDWSRRSPVSRRTSSSDWGPSEKKKQKFTEDEDDYRYRHEDTSNRFSPDSFSRSHSTKDFQHHHHQQQTPLDEDFRHRKTTQDSRHKYRHEECTYREGEDSTRRPSSGYYKGRDSRERSWDSSQEWRQSQDYTTKIYSKPRERNDSPVRVRKDQHHDREKFSLNGSRQQSFEGEATQQVPAALEQKGTKGFQRFLDVLNKGVNVEMLTKIVTQNCEEENPRPRSPIPFIDPVDRPWFPSCAEGQQGHYSESLRPHHGSFSPKRHFLSDERADGEHSGIASSSISRSRSPSVVEKTMLTPEDESKHRQMQDVLQAIGMDLGFEELGQMSHRIQERLYGKRDGDKEGHHVRSMDRNTRRAYSPKHRSRSSSSRSSFSPPSQKCYTEQDAENAPRDEPEVQRMQTLQSVDYQTNCKMNSNIKTLYDRQNCETDSEEQSVLAQEFSQSHLYTLPEPSPTPALPVYSPVNSQAMLYLPPPSAHPSSLLPTPPPSARPSPLLPTPPPSVRPSPLLPSPSPSRRPPPLLPTPRPSRCPPPLLLTPSPSAPPPALPRTLPPSFPGALPSALPSLPPYLSPVRPGLLLPPQHPLLPLTRVPNLNLFPGLVNQTRHPYPLLMNNLPPPNLNVPHLNPAQPTNNTQNKKQRPRCLQVIETKLAG